MIKNDLIFGELKKGTEYGNTLLVNKFYKPCKRTIASIFNIQYQDTGPIVNDALLKVIFKIDSIQFTTEKQFDSLVHKIAINTARDYLKKLNREKKHLRNEGIKLISIDQNSNLKNSDITSSEYEDEESLELDSDLMPNGEKEIFDEHQEKDSDNVKLEAVELEFFCDTDSIEENEKVLFIKKMLESFSSEDQILLRLYLNEIPFKDIAKFKGSNESTTRQYVNRLLKSFFKKAATKLNINYKEVYENFKEQNKRSYSKGINSGGSYTKRL